MGTNLPELPGAWSAKSSKMKNFKPLATIFPDVIDVTQAQGNSMWFLARRFDCSVYTLSVYDLLAGAL
jgi:hypothetical protein